MQSNETTDAIFDYCKRLQFEEAPKDDKGKLDWSVFPFHEAKEVVKVFEYGSSSEKYGAPFTYRNGAGVPERKLFAATIRHLIEIQEGREIADDSKCLHWAHVAANALMAIAALQKSQSLT